MSNRIPLEGLRFNRWTLGKYRHNKNNHSFYDAVCDCGTRRLVSGNLVRRGTSKSCGCYKRESVDRSSLNKWPYYKRIANVLRGMRIRCEKKDFIGYRNYGGRGIRIYQEWLDHFPSFYWYCIGLGYRPGLQLDRIDNDGNYEPGNLRFVDRKTNMRNSRAVTKVVFGDRIFDSASDFASYLGCERHVAMRLYKSFPVDHIIKIKNSMNPQKCFKWTVYLKKIQREIDEI